MRKLLAALVATAGLVLGSAGVAAPSMAATNPYVESWHTGDTIGNINYPTGPLADFSSGAMQPQTLNYVGKVSNSSCWPFTCGNGANNYFDGHNVYVAYHTGTSYCWTLSGALAYYTNTSCGTSHPYSLWVQTDAHNGQPWPWRTWVNVGATDGAGGKGQYLSDDFPGAQLEVADWTSGENNAQTFQIFNK